MDPFRSEHPGAKPVLPPPDTREGLTLYTEIETRILREHGLIEPFLEDFSS